MKNMVAIAALIFTSFVHSQARADTLIRVDPIRDSAIPPHGPSGLTFDHIF